MGSILILSSCQSFEIRDYQFYYKYRKELGGGGTKFGVLSGEFQDLNEEEIKAVEHLVVMMPPETWQMISADLIKACEMLNKKCKQSVSVVDDIFENLLKINYELEAGLENE